VLPPGVSNRIASEASSVTAPERGTPLGSTWPSKVTASVRAVIFSTGKLTVG